MINAIKERYKQEMEGRQIDGSADYGEEKSPTYDDDSPFEIWLVDCSLSFFLKFQIRLSQLLRFAF